MKKWLLALVGLWLFAGVAVANEGVATLSKDGVAGKCLAFSVYIDGVYDVSITCRNLSVAPDATNNYYVAWVADERGAVRRLGEVQRGKFFGGIDTAFVRVFVTLEAESSPSKPSDKQVLMGDVKAMPFGESYGGAVVAPVKVTPVPTVSVKPANNTQTTSSSTGAGAVLRTIGRVFGLAVVVLLVAGVILTVVTRRKEIN